MAEGPVRTGEDEVIRKVRHTDRKVRRDAFAFCAIKVPDVAKVFARATNKGKARPPGCVEAGGADDDVDVVFFAFAILKPIFSDAVDTFGEDSSVGADEGLEVAWSRGRTPTAGIEVYGNDLFTETGVALEFANHLLAREFSSHCRLFATFDDELEALIQLIFYLFPVFEVFLRMF